MRTPPGAPSPAFKETVPPARNEPVPPVGRRGIPWVGVIVLVLILVGLGVWRWYEASRPPRSAGSDPPATGPSTGAVDGDVTTAGATLRELGWEDVGGEVVSLAVSPDGYWQAWGLAERGAGIVVRDGRGKGRSIQFRPIGFTAQTTSASFIDEQTLLATMGDSVYLCSTRTRVASPLIRYEGERRGIPLCVAGSWGPGGRLRVAVGLSSGVVELTEAEVSGGVGLLGGEPTQVGGHTGAVRGITFLRNGQYVASASEDATIRVVYASDGKYVTRQPIAIDGTGPEFARSIGVLSSPTIGDVWLAATGRNTAVIWDPRAWTVTYRLRGSVHGSLVTRLAFSADGLLATASADALAVWDMETGKEIAHVVRPHGGRAVGGLAFADRGTTLLSGGADGRVRTWGVVGRR